MFRSRGWKGSLYQKAKQSYPVADVAGLPRISQGFISFNKSLGCIRVLNPLNSSCDRKSLVSQTKAVHYQFVLNVYNYCGTIIVPMIILPLVVRFAMGTITMNHRIVQGQTIYWVHTYTSSYWTNYLLHRNSIWTLEEPLYSSKEKILTPLNTRWLTLWSTYLCRIQKSNKSGSKTESEILSEAENIKLPIG